MTRPLNQVAVGPPRMSRRILTRSAGWLTRRPIRRETSRSTSKISPAMLPNRAARQGNKSRRSPAM